jgi:hypothetical protein
VRARRHCKRRWSNEPSADIAEGVDIIARRDAVRQDDAVFAEKIALPRWMHAQHQHHRRFLLAVKGDVVPCPDDHVKTPRSLGWRSLSAGERVRSQAAIAMAAEIHQS